MKTVTVGNAGRNLPGLVSRPTLEDELMSHGSRSTYDLFPESHEKNEAVEGLTPGQQALEAGLGATLFFAGVHGAGKDVEKLAKSSPTTKLEAKVEKGIEKIHPLTWAQELAKLLSAESLKRLGLIIAGALLLIFAAFMLSHAMGGPTPAIIPV